MKLLYLRGKSILTKSGQKTGRKGLPRVFLADGREIQGISAASLESFGGAKGEPPRRMIRIEIDNVDIELISEPPPMMSK
jgi:hypothetical protein